MLDKEYIENEVKMLYKYGMSNDEKSGDKKIMYSAIFKSLKSTIECDIGGIEYLSVTNKEIKEIIKNVVDNSNMNN